MWGNDEARGQGEKKLLFLFLNERVAWDDISRYGQKERIYTGSWSGNDEEEEPPPPPPPPQTNC